MSDYFDNPEWHGCHDDNGDRLHDPLCKRSDAECRADEPPLTKAEKVWRLIDVGNAMLAEREAEERK